MKRPTWKAGTTPEKRIFQYVLLNKLKTRQGGNRRPTFTLGDFVEAFVGERSPFEEGAM